MSLANKKKKASAISPTRAENFSEWYLAVIQAADLAEHASTKGCMVIKPLGMGLWEKMQQSLDRALKASGHQNVYFPLLIPLSLLEKEAAHVAGFAKECAVVTHRRLELNAQNKLACAAPLEEPLVVRPTSEVLFGERMASWIQSHRDLPMLLNQWANIVRLEMRTRLFLRNSEFLWQEIHAAHATADEANDHALAVLEIYRHFVEEELAIPLICGKKVASERFPGAEETYTIEAMTQDKKAIQMGTSHFLGQNFSKAFDIKFRAKDGSMQLAWTTSCGVSTRMIGALIMVHADDDGLILPPRIAPTHIVLIPVVHDKEHEAKILLFCKTLATRMADIEYRKEKLVVVVDYVEGVTAGERRWRAIKKGVPVIIEIGLRDIEAGSVQMRARTDIKNLQPPFSIDSSDGPAKVVALLEQIQKTLFERAQSYALANTHDLAENDSFENFFSRFSQEGSSAGFVLGSWSKKGEAEEGALKENFSVTPRCLPLPRYSLFAKNGIFADCGELVVYAKSY